MVYPSRGTGVRTSRSSDGSDIVALTPNVVTGVVGIAGIAGAVGATWLSHRFARRMAKDSRAQDRREKTYEETLVYLAEISIGLAEATRNGELYEWRSSREHHLAVARLRLHGSAAVWDVFTEWFKAQGLAQVAANDWLDALDGSTSAEENDVVDAEKLFDQRISDLIYAELAVKDQMREELRTS